MALIIGFGLFLASVLTAALSRIIAEEFVAWNPFFVRWLIRIAVARLPENHRERFEEEWRSDVDEVPGVVGKLVRAADCSRAAYRMALTERRDCIVDRWMRTVEGTNAALSKSVKMMTAIQADTLLPPHDRDALVPRMQTAKTAIDKYEHETNGVAALFSGVRSRPAGLIGFLLLAGCDKVLRARLERIERDVATVAAESDKIIQCIELRAPKLGPEPRGSRSRRRLK